MVVNFFGGVVLGGVIGYLVGWRRELRTVVARRRAASREAEALTRAELYERAQAADIPGRSAMSKDELREALDAKTPSLGAEIVQAVSGRESEARR